MGHPSSGVVQVLLDRRRDFLAFLERRVGERAVAEDLLQEAFVRGLEGAAGVEPASAVAWFYQVLRNALIDRARRQGSSAAALERLAREIDAEPASAPDARPHVCRCVGHAARSLKPEYAEALAAVEVEGHSLADFARGAGITANNAGVRVHRAREALKKQVHATCGSCAENGCVDCTCQHPQAGTSAYVE